MLYLFEAIACGALFSQSYKFSLSRSYDVDWVSSSAFGFSALFLLLTPMGVQEGIAWPPIWLGISYGLSGGLTQFALFHALSYGALSVSWTIMQMSMIMPVLGSILFWGERPTVWQAGAITGALLAVAMMGDVELRQVKQPLAWVGWLGLSYVTAGLAGISMKAVGHLGAGRWSVTFLLVSYIVSALLGLLLVRGRRLRRQEAAMGAVRGLAMVLTDYLLLKALVLLPGYLVFAAFSVASVVINVLAAVLIWGERPKSQAAAGVLLAVASIVGLNL